jgi:hypothetical protein
MERTEPPSGGPDRSDRPVGAVSVLALVKSVAGNVNLESMLAETRVTGPMRRLEPRMQPTSRSQACLTQYQGGEDR